MRRLLDEWKDRFERHLLMRGFSARTVEGYVSELSPLFGFLEKQLRKQSFSVKGEKLTA